MTYMTPIMYDIAIIDDPALLFVFKCNPMYWFLYFIRWVMLYHTIPEPNVWLYSMIFAVGFLVLGIFVFKKNQDKFIYYV